LAYLVADTAKRWGSVRVGAAASFVRSDDPALIAELVRHRKAARLELRMLAPTVAASAHDADEVVSVLRDAGFLPAVVNADGVIVHATRRPRRIGEPAARRPKPATTPAVAGSRNGADDRRDDPLALAVALLDRPLVPPAPSASRHRDGRRQRPRSGVPADNHLRLLTDDDLDDLDGPAALAHLLGLGPETAAQLAGLLHEDDGDEDVFDDDDSALASPDELLDLLHEACDSGIPVELLLFDLEAPGKRAVTGHVAGIEPSGSVVLAVEPLGQLETAHVDDVISLRYLKG
jgi:hypothetical protein